jgi:hypothetical protein
VNTLTVDTLNGIQYPVNTLTVDTLNGIQYPVNTLTVGVHSSTGANYDEPGKAVGGRHNNGRIGTR